MTQTPAVLAIGNAIVDALVHTDDAFLQERNLEKGSMQLLSLPAVQDLYAQMGSAREVSGGSAANTAAGIAALGGSVRFIGHVADDRIGDFFTHDIRAAGVRYDTAPGPKDPPTGQCLVLVTKDAQRTMGTFLGASQDLTPHHIDPRHVQESQVVYLEGYLWDSPTSRSAIKKASDIARQSGSKIAFSLADSFCVERHYDDFFQLAQGNIDLLFANEMEIKALYHAADFTEVSARLQQSDHLVPDIVLVTHGDKGASLFTKGEWTHVPTKSVQNPVDTTGAGDLFAAGFLYGFTQGMTLEKCVRVGNIAAASIISHFGARPQEDIKALASHV